MKKVLLLSIGLLFFASCEQDTVVSENEGINLESSLTRGADKINVCHKGNVISVSASALGGHQGHGDAVDMDGDGYFDIENDCSEVDCDDTTFSETNSCGPAQIGDLVEGGIVFYIASTPTDLDGDGTLDTGLVCALEDQGSAIRWYNGVFGVTGATGGAIGTGSANTAAIIAFQGATATSYAAGVAQAYAGGGSTDWFLPSTDELNEMYVNQTAINNGATANGGAVLSGQYWTSTELNFRGASKQNFNDGAQGADLKFVENSVRAVKAF